MEQIRSFVAIELDAALKTVLYDVQRELKRSKVSHIGRWVSTESIHLTLKFLGDVPAEQVTRIEQAMHGACAPFAPFPVSLTELGCFPNARQPRVIWVGVGGDLESLMPLQRAVESELGQVGFQPEKRGFTPHLTLARIQDKARPQERQEMAQLLSSVRVDSSVSMMVAQVSLMRSELKPTGAVYTRLAAAPLGQH